MNSNALDQLERAVRLGCVLVGVGNTARGDDGFGPALIARLRGHTSLALLDAGPVPENYLERIARAQTPVVVFADALALDAPKGSLHWIQADDIGAGGASTHTGSLKIAALYLKQTCGAHVALLGVVAQDVRFGQPLSPPVARAIDTLAQTIVRLSPANESLRPRSAAIDAG